MKEKLKELINKIIKSGVWLFPFIFAAILTYDSDSPGSQTFLPCAKSSADLISAAWIAFIVTALITLNKKPDIKEDDTTSGKRKAMYPPVNEALLYKQPSGIVLGKYGNKYVCRQISEDGHIAIIGGSGSGKSSTVMGDTILINDATSRIFAIDIKGELHTKFTKLGNPKNIIFDPQDRLTYGYDPLFRLTDNSSSQEIYETMQCITYSLLPLPPGVKDPFWIRSARNLLLSLLIYNYKIGIKDFVGLLDCILSSPISESIDEVLDESYKGSPEYRLITQFADMAEETLGSIVAEMNNHIVVFANDQDIRFAFRENRRKFNPAMLESGYNIFLAIREDKLSAYYDVLQLIINQTLEALERRPENSPPIILMLDELPRILSAGKIERLLDAARTLRSRKVTLMIVAQSAEGLMTAYSENEVSDLLGNCLYIIILHSNSQKTQRMVSDMAGRFNAKKVNFSKGVKGWTTGYSFTELSILGGNDILMLPHKNEAVLLSPFGYSRIKKVPYYKDKILSPIALEIKKYNETILNIKRGEKT